MKVSEIMNRRQRPLLTVRGEDTVETVSSILASNNIGALPVRDGTGALVGLISERDIVRGFAEQGGKVHELKVSDLMTANVITCGLEDTVDQAMQVMNLRHIRHLPVVANDELLGIISSRDVMKSVIEDTTLERDVLRDFAIAAR